MHYFQYSITRAAKAVGVSPNTLRRWEARKLAGDPKFANFPNTPRIPHSNHRAYEEADIKAIVSWMLTGDVSV